MVVTKIGLNFSAISNTPPPSFNITNQTPAEFVDSIPVIANNITNDLFGIIVLLTLIIGLWWILSEKSQFAKYQYSKMRGLAIAIGVALVMGANMLQIGFMTSYIHFVYLNTLYMILFIWTFVKNPS